MGTNIYSTKNPVDIDLICLYAVAYWYNEIKLYDFDNPKYSVKTGNDTSLITELLYFSIFAQVSITNPTR